MQEIVNHKIKIKNNTGSIDLFPVKDQLYKICITYPHIIPQIDNASLYISGVRLALVSPQDMTIICSDEKSKKVQLNFFGDLGDLPLYPYMVKSGSWKLDISAPVYDNIEVEVELYCRSLPDYFLLNVRMLSIPVFRTRGAKEKEANILVYSGTNIGYSFKV